MSDSTTISGRVEVEQTSHEFVAFKLMEKIGHEESGEQGSNQDSRDYWLTLYRQCYKAAFGRNLVDILKRE